MALKIEGFPEVFVRVGTSLLGELNHPFLMKVVFVVISGNVLVQTVRNHEVWVCICSVLSTGSPFQQGDAMCDMHGSFIA